MKLVRIYSEPEGLFEPVDFVSGINFIFGKKDTNSNNKESLNGIGKTSFIELIDFCLCADFSPSKSKRLYKFLDILENYTIALEATIAGNSYIIRRAFDDPKSIEINENGEFHSLELKEARKLLFKKIFYSSDYEGVLKDEWFRSMISFFIKMQKRSKNDFVDPILYQTSSNSATFLNQFHLYFLGLNNDLSYKNFELQNSIKDKDATLRELKKLIEKSYRIPIKEANKKLDTLLADYEKQSLLVEKFKLAEQHESLETKLDTLTETINRIQETSYWDKKKLSGYKETVELKDSLTSNQIRSIHKMYAELNTTVAGEVKKSLEEAVLFRKSLSKSRTDFLKKEIISLEKGLELKKKSIIELDAERIEFFKLLEAKKAISSLTDSYRYLGVLQSKITELKGRLDTYKEIQSEKDKWKINDTKLREEAGDVIEKSLTRISEFRAIFTDVYNNVYSSDYSASFTVDKTLDSRQKNKIAIEVSFESEESKGWNKGRTLVYDISVLFNGLKNNDIRLPHFLIHDGIFDSMDKAHFVELYHFLNKRIKPNFNFQYIVTLNEEGTLSEAFGDTDDLSPEQIADEAILVLTPSKKLWNVR